MSEIITTKEALDSGISRNELYRFLSENGYEQAAFGIYVRKDSIIDSAYIVHLRCPNAVVSHDEALYYHGLTDREPFQPTVTVYTGYNTKRLTDTGVKVFTVKKELLDVGKISVTNFFGHSVPMYDLERTVCDLVRNRSYFEKQDFLASLKSYFSGNDKNLNKLMEYAALFRVEKIIKKYAEVLLEC